MYHQYKNRNWTDKLVPRTEHNPIYHRKVELIHHAYLALKLDKKHKKPEIRLPLNRTTTAVKPIKIQTKRCHLPIK